MSFVGSGVAIDKQDLEFEDTSARFFPSSRVGVLTAEIGTARFTRLQVVYGNNSTVTLIPTGLTSRLLSRLVLKRSLLEVVPGAGAASLGGAFAGPIPEPDFETWFWLVPHAPKPTSNSERNRKSPP